MGLTETGKTLDVVRNQSECATTSAGGDDPAGRVRGVDLWRGSGEGVTERHVGWLVAVHFHGQSRLRVPDLLALGRDLDDSTRPGDGDQGIAVHAIRNRRRERFRSFERPAVAGPSRSARGQNGPCGAGLGSADQIGGRFFGTRTVRLSNTL